LFIKLRFIIKIAASDTVAEAAAHAKGIERAHSAVDFNDAADFTIYSGKLADFGEVFHGHVIINGLGLMERKD
jgi:hypothetical protein